MKALLLILIIIIPEYLFGVNSLGIKIGLNDYQLNGTNVSAPNSGWSAGLFWGLNTRSGKVGFRLEALYSNQSFNLTDNYNNNNNFNFTASYIEVPLLFKFKLFRSMTIFLGAEASQMLSAECQTSNIQEVNENNFTPSLMFSGVAGLEFKISRIISIGARYVAPFSNTNSSFIDYNNNSQNYTWQNNNLHFNLNFFILGEPKKHKGGSKIKEHYPNADPPHLGNKIPVN